MILVTSSAIQRVELQQESYTKKATDKEVSYEFLSKEEELTRSSWRTWRYYEFCQQVVELNKSLVKECITSSTNKRWSSKRLLGKRLLLRVLPGRGGARGLLGEAGGCYFRGYLNGEASRRYQGNLCFRGACGELESNSDLLGTAGGWTPVPRSGDTCGTSWRGSPGGCGGCSALPIGTSQLLE